MPSSQLTILQINDTHAYLDLHPELFWEGGRETYRMAGGYARLSTLVSRIRQETGGNCILLDNGDTLHGTYPAVESQGKVLTPILNHLRFEAMTAHWEFAYGPEIVYERARELAYPLLALNIHKKTNGEMPFPSSRVVEKAGLRVGIIGLASNIVDKTMPPSFSRGLIFELGKDELPAEIDRLRTVDKADLIILLSHLGYPQDLQLVQDVPGIDVCLSGHTHNRLYQAAIQDETILIQSGSHGSFLGRLDLEIEDGTIRTFHHRLIEVGEGVIPDPEVEDLVGQAVAPYREMLSHPVGETRTPLHRHLNLETPMDNLLLEALLHTIGAEIAFSNGWRYGAPILPGAITLNDLYNIIPTNPPVSQVEMTGEEITQMLEENLESTYARNPYRQMGGYVKRAMGLKVLFKVENPYPHRIQQLFIGDRELEPGRIYRAAFITEQGVPSKYGRDRKHLGISAVDALRQFLAEKGPYKTKLRHPFVLV